MNDPRPLTRAPAAWQALFDSPALHLRPLVVSGYAPAVSLADTLSATASVSWGPDRIDLFTVGSDRGLVHRAFNDGRWSEETQLGGTLASPPAATAWGVDQLQVFAIFDDGQLWNRYWDGESWHPWESLGGSLTGTPAASSWSADRIDVFAPGRDGGTWHRWWEGERWVDWEIL